ncbi:flagellar biosynthesis protein FlhF [Salirhabdus salicampi]|uniref:flagellar biosynthesis protein FlhF n=1 Tax=Salirhabdus salicampi TaxID=476102 RepID=UPI0020C1C18B|nr:flagellar biosynthesis protein FlhF [Salirhabdus salicampi]MCP8616504.1 flagellar biosynthesis protein FlhF [Salirhabdus salicampi]
MKVKKFKAPTMIEAMHLVRKELGNDAVILNSKEVNKKGMLGLFRKKDIEVIAATDPQPVQHKVASKREDSVKPLIDRNELSERLRNSEREKGTSTSEQSLKQKDTIPYPEQVQSMYNHLLEIGISEDNAKEIVDYLFEQYYLHKKQATDKDIKKWIEEFIESNIRNLTFGAPGDEKKILHFIGPTGVGKTTTIAKVAAKASIEEGKKVSLITTDTYRIAAIEQLKTYAKILNIPIEIVYNSDDYIQAIEKFQSYDLVLIDTAGRNYKDRQYAEQLKSLTPHKTENEEAYLVLSLNTREKDIYEICDQLIDLPIHRFIFTKCDEASNFGTIYNVMMKYKKGVAYFTTGQVVPDDIEVASTANMISTIMEGRKQ